MRDLDGDGKADLIVNRVWEKNGLAPGADATLPSGWTQYTYSTTWTAQSTFVDTGDFNSDGRLDIVLTPSERVGQRYHISWFETPQDRASAWSEHIVDPDVESVHHFVAAADMNLDGTVDVVTAEMAQGVSKEVKVYLNEGSGAAWTKRVIATTASHSCRVADLDGDVDIELFGANWRSSVSPSGPSVELWMNQTLELGALLPIDAWHYSTVDNARAKFDTVADMNGDGRPDVVTGEHRGTKKVAIWENVGAGTSFVEHVVSKGKESHLGARVVDLDHDGDLDIISIAWDEYALLHLWRNDAL